MTGFEVLERLKADPATRGHPRHHPHLEGPRRRGAPAAGGGRPRSSPRRPSRRGGVRDDPRGPGPGRARPDRPRARRRDMADQPPATDPGRRRRRGEALLRRQDPPQGGVRGPRGRRPAPRPCGWRPRSPTWSSSTSSCRTSAASRSAAGSRPTRDTPRSPCCTSPPPSSRSRTGSRGWRAGPTAT